MIRNLLIALFLLAAMGTAASADDYSPEASEQAILLDADLGLIDHDTAWVYRTFAFFQPDSLPLAYRLTAAEGAHADCATGFLVSLQSAWPGLSDAAKARIAQAAPPMPPAQFGRETIVPTKGAAAALGDYPHGVDPGNVYYTEHFALRWGPNKSYTAGELSDLGDIMEEIWGVEVDDMGYMDPIKSDQYFTDVYVGNSGGGAPDINFQGAYTTIYNEWPNTMAYIVMWPDILDHLNSYRDVLSHEFFHVLQFSIALQSCFSHMSGDGSDWAVEATATWAEDEVYDDINYYAYFIDEHMGSPEITLFSTSGIMLYSRVIYFKYISENFGGRAALFDIWNTCYNSLFASVSGYLNTNYGTSTENTFPEFSLKTLFRDYEEGSIYSAPYIHGTFSSYPVDREFSNGKLPQNWGTNYLRFLPTGGGATKLNVRFEGTEKFGSRTVDYDLAVVKVRSDDTYEVEQMGAAKAGNAGEITVEDFGGEWAEVYLVVTATTATISQNSGGLPYTILATLGDEDFPTDDDDDSDDDTGDDDDDDDDDSSGDCTSLLGKVYDECDASIESMSGSEALDSCEGDSGPWDCLRSCADAAGGCDELLECFESECGIDSASGSGDDDDDDDSGCGC